MSSRIFSRAGRLSPAVAERIMIGRSSALNLKMTGIVAPSGSSELTRSSLSLTSFVATSISTPHSNSSIIRQMFSLDWEVMSFRSLTPLRAFSRTFERLVSMSSALAPGYEDMTIITLASNSGSWSIDILIRENIPRIAQAAKTREVVTGLLTAFLYMLIDIVTSVRRI